MHADRTATAVVTGPALLSRYEKVRSRSDALRTPLSPEDCQIQSMTDASPVKWHLAHTTWFFETFVLGARVPGYRPFHPDFKMLYNSYYNLVGEQYPRDRRGLVTRPTLDTILQYRRHVDEAVATLLSGIDEADPELQLVIETGLNHEQQHQELILTDVKHALSFNPLNPAYRPDVDLGTAPDPGALRFVGFDEGVREIGRDADGFCFDNESPRHRTFVHAFELGSRLVTNAEYLAFMADGGYRRPELWLSDGWAAVQREGWNAPMYWRERDGEWWSFTLTGLRLVDLHEPVSHVSHFEADAFARWADARLATEAEWEVAASDRPVEGVFVDDERFHPMAPDAASGDHLVQIFGNVWEWTQSPYVGYPGYRPHGGALGEYNGKFMCDQTVLRGGSCASSRSHLRATYRNFFPSTTRWQFTGIRLARDVRG